MVCVQVSVALRGRQACMPEKLLNRTEIRAAREEMRGEAMTECVRAHALGQRKLSDAALHHAADASICQSTTLVVQEECVAPRGRAQTVGEIGQKRLARLGPEGNDPFLAPLPKHANHAGLEVDLTNVEADELGAAYARGVEELQDRPASRGPAALTGHIQEPSRPPPPRGEAGSCARGEATGERGLDCAPAPPRGRGSGRTCAAPPACAPPRLFVRPSRWRRARKARINRWSTSAGRASRPSSWSR